MRTTFLFSNFAPMDGGRGEVLKLDKKMEDITQARAQIEALLTKSFDRKLFLTLSQGQAIKVLADIGQFDEKTNTYPASWNVPGCGSGTVRGEYSAEEMINMSPEIFQEKMETKRF